MTTPSYDSTTMFYGSVTLPQDIVDIIIDNLSDNKSSLKACSLVASAWRSTSQKLLHRTMVFRTSLPLSAGHAVSNASHSPASSSEKTRLLLGTSFHLLRYARSFIIRGDRNKGFCRGGNSRPKPQPRVSDSSLFVFLWQISSLALPLLSSIELHDLIWTRVDADLRRSLISLLSQGFVKGVSLVNCTIPLGVQWLRFIGPETMSLQLHRITIFDNLSAEQETPITGIPISSAPKLTDLHFGQLCGSEVIQWILGSLEAPSTPSNATTAVLRRRSWHESITTLSLYCCNSMEDLFKLVQTLPGLTTLKFNTRKLKTRLLIQANSD
ncbi:hypothetical protein ONZ45_g17800 [Pleurotus djamor]|nr:hypothetical protein ONZ45_g17800 [Pleurotus djamor]